MNSSRTSLRLLRRARPNFFSKCTYATTPYSTPAPHPSTITESDINGARRYCSNLIQNFDSPAYTLQTFLPPSSLDAYLSIRALNIELARIPDLVSNPTVGALRMQFWRDNLTRTFAGTPPQEPVAILLHHALSILSTYHPSSSTQQFQTLKNWCMKIIGEREKYMDNRPYTDLAALETYAENTYSTLLYLTLASMGLHSIAADHLASHIGKATGIAAVLRGIPLIAFPPPPNAHSNNSAFNGQLGGQTGGRHGAVMLPLDIMVEAGVKEEEVYRRGAEAPGLKDAVFKVATRANDHLITAGEMLRNLQSGEDIGHEFEHEGEDGHEYASANFNARDPSDAVSTSTKTNNKQLQEVYRGFGALMPAISTKLWLEKLEEYDFDVFRPELRIREWKLPWRAYWAFRRKKI